MPRPVASWLAFALVGVTSSMAAAQQAEPSDARARAKQLFDEGREEIQRGLVASGCKKLLESHRLAPKAVGPLLNVADCDERAGRLATAWRRFRQVEKLPEASAERKEYARKRAASLEPRVPRLTLVAPPNTADDLQVTHDGIVLDAAAFEEPLRLDPGRHRFVVRAPGHHERSFEVVLVAEMIDELALSTGPPIAPAAAPSPVLPAPVPKLPPPDDAGMSGSELAGWILGGFGVSALVVGAVTGVLVAVHASTYDEHCDDRGGCDQEGLDAAEAGRPLAVVSPIALGVGGVAVGVAIPLILTGGSSEPAARGLRLGIGGTF